MSSIVIPIITLIVGAVLGSGGVWQWKQFELNQKNYELEKAKYELEKIPKTIEIRNNIEGNMVKVLNLSKKHAELIKEIDKYPDGTREKENIGREIDRM